MRSILDASLLCAAFLLLAGFAGEVAASSSTASAVLSVEATIATTCRVVSPAVSANGLNGRNPVDVQCTSGVTSLVTVGHANDGQTLIATVVF